MLRQRTLLFMQPLVFNEHDRTPQVPSTASVRIALFEISGSPEDKIGFTEQDENEFRCGEGNAQTFLENARACAKALREEKRLLAGQSARFFDSEIIEVLTAMCLKFAIERKASREKRRGLESMLGTLPTWDRNRVTDLLVAAIKESAAT